MELATVSSGGVCSLALTKIFLSRWASYRRTKICVGEFKAGNWTCREKDPRSNRPLFKKVGWKRRARFDNIFQRVLELQIFISYALLKLFFSKLKQKSWSCKFICEKCKLQRCEKLVVYLVLWCWHELMGATVKQTRRTDLLYISVQDNISWKSSFENL